MASFSVDFRLSYSGLESDEHFIDFYDVAQALMGFERSLAITTHLVLNDQVITQAPSLKGAKIYALPPLAGSWEIIATVIGGLGYLGTRPKDTPIGHLVHSAYDYVVKSALGVHVDYNKSLGQLYEEYKGKVDVPILDESRFDSAVEKSENAFAEMHRPLIKSRSADQAVLYSSDGYDEISELNTDTYAYVRETHTSAASDYFRGFITSYNVNTYRGRIYIPDLNRPIPFELSDMSRDSNSIRLIAESLLSNVTHPLANQGLVEFEAFKNESRNGRLKSLYVLDVS